MSTMTAHELFHDLRHVHSTAASRVSALEALAGVQTLSDAEETELVMLRSRLVHLGPRMEAAAAALVQQSDRLDVQAVCAEWQTLVDAKQAAYAQFVDAARYLRDCHAQLVAIHRQQEQAVERLPRQIQTRLNFPDSGTFNARLSGTMRNPMAWTAVFCVPQGMELPRSDELQSVDPGSQPLAPRVIQRFLEGRP